MTEAFSGPRAHIYVNSMRRLELCPFPCGKEKWDPVLKTIVPQASKLQQLCFDFIEEEEEEALRILEASKAFLDLQSLFLKTSSPDLRVARSLCNALPCWAQLVS